MERKRRERVRREGSRGCIYRAKLHFGQAVSKPLEATLVLQLEKKVRFQSLGHARVAIAAAEV
jgi:hypothetical protein